jgi:hypothetical protein
MGLVSRVTRSEKPEHDSHRDERADLDPRFSTPPGGLSSQWLGRIF